MSQPQPQPIGLQRLGWLLVVVGLVAVPFVGLVADAPIGWYLASAAYLSLLSELVKRT